MKRRELPKPGKLVALRSFAIINFAAIIGFFLGTVSFTASMILFPNATFAFLFANAVGGLSHFGSNYVMQSQRKEKFVKNFFVFNATGVIGFLVESAVFAVAIILIQDPTASWLCSCIVGTLSHFVLNDTAMKFQLK